MKLVEKLIMFVAMLTGLLLPSAVYATDSKVFPGVSCQPFAGSQASDFTHGITGIINTSQSDRLISCPIVRDNNAVTVGENVFILVNVQSFNSKLLPCTAFSIAFGAIVFDTASDNTSSNFSTLLTMNISTGGDFTQGYYNIVCRLPPGGQLFNYVVVEPKDE